MFSARSKGFIWYFTRLWIYLSTVRRRICAFCWTNKESVNGFPGCTTSFLLSDLHPPPPCWGPTMCPHCDYKCRQINMRHVDQTCQGTVLHPPPPWWAPTMCPHCHHFVKLFFHTKAIFWPHTPTLGPLSAHQGNIYFDHLTQSPPCIPLCQLN